jgi:hypothetical protein
MSPEERYASIVDVLRDAPGVSCAPASASGPRRFGSSGQLKVGEKIFAFLSSKRRLVVKLPRRRVDELVAAGKGERFDPGHGRLMKEWLSVGLSFEGDWLVLAREAMAYVDSQR